MTTLLQINADPLAGGTSRELAERLIAQLRRRNRGSRLIVRNLDDSFTPSMQEAPADARDEAVEELKAADVVVLDLPSRPSAGPSPLKAWFDHLVNAGIRFEAESSETGRLVGDRKFYVVAASGGFHKGTVRDTQTLYVRDFLNFLGIHDVEFISAETPLGDAALLGETQTGVWPELEALAA